MTHIERVRVALAGGRPDRVPRGEFALEPGLVAALVRREKAGTAAGAGDLSSSWRTDAAFPGHTTRRNPGASFQSEIAARELLGMDLLAVTPAAPVAEQGSDSYQDAWGCRYTNRGKLKVFLAPAIPDIGAAAGYTLPDPASFDLQAIRRWREETDFFVLAFVDGPFQGTGRLFDFTEFLLAAAAREGVIKELAAAVADFNLELARLCRQAGAHGIIIGDDIAYDRGTYIRPDLWRELFLPLLRCQVEGLKEMDLPVLYHSDGNLQAVLPDLAGLPLDGLQGLEPAAGMDIGAVKREYGEKLCLMGNFDLDLLVTGNPDTITAAVHSLLDVAAPGGGYIFSTACGILHASLPPENVLALYRAVDEYGRYQ
ncbi:uroporphyrinogen decarboxylase family protein [Moorella naiadis]|uniref:uroporphyrinogen decarboxylase family protein n=1 Tax=Moorella naiadis (nom. illeg.) TaxID=3093670 RepID=UPI003D9CAA4F